MPDALPKVTRDYRNHHLDNTRWRSFEPREGDVIITTSYKSGTTWMQHILHSLVYRDEPNAPPTMMVSPWVDARFQMPLADVTTGLKALQKRRFVKSHLPLDGLPYYPEARYVIVGRDSRDVFMSLWNHYRNYTDEIMARLNGGDDFVGDPLPAPPTSEDPEAMRQLFRQWMGCGWFEWEHEGWPFWGNLHHTQTYWDYRHLENFLFVHYTDLLTDPHGQIRRVAEFVGEPVTDAELDTVVEKTALDEMRKAMKPLDEGFRQGFKGGVETFLYKGTNGRWRDVFGDEELTLYERTRDRVLSPDCAKWLEEGSLGGE